MKVESEGEKNFEFAERLWSEVVRVCRENDCYDVLGVTYSTVTMSKRPGNGCSAMTIPTERVPCAS